MRILDGRHQFYQWDLNQRLTADGLAVGDEIHFANALSTEALVVKAYVLEDGTVVADVPNALLRDAYPIEAYRYIIEGTTEHTIKARTFEVQKRPRPSDYIYTETEVHSFEQLAEHVKEALATLDEFNAKQAETLKELGEADEAIREEMGEQAEALKELGEADEAIREELGEKADATATEEALAGKIDIPKNPGSNKALVSRWNGAVELWGMTSTPESGALVMFSGRKTLQTEAATDEKDAVPLAQMQEALTEKADVKAVDTLAKKVENIEAGTAADAFIVDDSTAYVKPIPADVAPYAELLAVGGMTHKIAKYGDNLLDTDFVNQYDPEVYADGDTIYLSYTNYGWNAWFSDLFRGLVIGKQYILTVSATGGDLAPATIDTGGVPLDTPFTLTEEHLYASFAFQPGYADDGGAGQPCGGEFVVILREVTDVLLDTPVTALDIVGKNLYNGGFGGNACATEENGVLTMTKTGAYDRYSVVWFPPFEISEASISADIISNNLNSVFNAEVKYKNGDADYFTIAKTGEVGIKTGKIMPRADGSKINSISLYIQHAAETGVSITLTDILIQPTVTPTDTTYSPYHKTTFAIPAAVQALEGYGWGVNGAVNGVEWDENGKPTFVKRVDKVVYNGTEWFGKSSWQDAVQYWVTPTGYKPNGNVIANRFKSGTPYAVGLPCVHGTPDPIAFYPDNPPDTVEGWKALLAEWYAEGNPLTVYYELAEPIVTDISAYFTEDNLIPVEGGGTITAVNEDALAAPTTIIYRKRGFK